jgi:hypothetical protein
VSFTLFYSGRNYKWNHTQGEFLLYLISVANNFCRCGKIKDPYDYIIWTLAISYGFSYTGVNVRFYVEVWGSNPFSFQIGLMILWLTILIVE